MGLPSMLVTAEVSMFSVNMVLSRILDKTYTGGKDSESAKVMVEKIGRKQNLLYKRAFCLGVFILFLERQR